MGSAKTVERSRWGVGQKARRKSALPAAGQLRRCTPESALRRLRLPLARRFAGRHRAIEGRDSSLPLLPVVTYLDSNRVPNWSGH
jgi:hypothetical protein